MRLKQGAMDALRGVRRQWRDLRRAVRGPLVRRLHAGRPMRVVMTLLARDEADIVAAMIEHHLDLGVDFIIATDNGSVDGTAEILAAYRELGVLELIEERDQTFEQGRWVTRMARIAAEKHQASWVINADADEFIWPTEGGVATSLKQVLAGVGPGYGVIGLDPDHHAVHPGLSGNWTRTALFRQRNPVEPPAGSTRYWKAMHRADPAIRIRMGNHDADGPRIGPLFPGRPFRVLHYPDRGLAHFTRKVRNGGSALAANARLGRHVGLHWRHDYALLADGRFEAAYRARHPDAAQVEALIASGQWIADTRVPDRLRALAGRARRPDLLRAVLEAPG